MSRAICSPSGATGTVWNIDWQTTGVACTDVDEGVRGLSSLRTVPITLADPGSAACRERCRFTR
jgi:hypothetical protein